MLKVSKPSFTKPKMRRIPLVDLLRRRGYAGTLQPRVRKAMIQQISATGLYPSLIVRPHPRRTGKFEILDGHHRTEILRELGFPDARCEVWGVGDSDAELYVLGLNHLHGRPSGISRARQLVRLIRRFGERRISELLALTPAAIRQNLAPLRPPQERKEHVKSLNLQAVVFHLPPAEAKLLNRILRTEGDGKQRRGQVLMQLVRANVSSNNLKEE